MKIRTNKNELLEKSIFKIFIKYFIPTLIGSIVVVLYNIVDRFFVGKISEEALAGAGIAFYIVMIIIACTMLVGVGSSTLISLRLGSKKRKEAEKILGNAIVMFLIIGIFLFIVLNVNMENILLFSGANNETLPYAKAYLTIILYTIFPLFYSYGLMGILTAAGAPRIAMFSLAIGGIINIILDYISVIILKTGIEGTAYATLIGNLVASIFVVYFLIVGKTPFTINLFGYKLETRSKIRIRLKYLKLNTKLCRNIIGIGLSPFILQVASSFVGLITNKIVEIYGGTSGVAIVTIINSYLPIVTITVYSIAQAMQPIIGYNYGAKRYDRVKKSLYISMLVSVIISTIFWFFIMIFPKELIILFNSKGSIASIKQGVTAIRIYFSLIILSSFGIIVPNHFQSTGRPRYSVILNLTRQIILFLISLFVFTKLFKLKGVWLAQPFTDAVFFVILFIVTLREILQLNKKIKQKNR